MHKSHLKTINETLEKIGKKSLLIIDQDKNSEDHAMAINKMAKSCHERIEKILRELRR
jgi:hypothetical protein